MDAGDIGIVGGLFASFIDDFFHCLGFIFDDFFDVGGMNTSIQDQFRQRAATDLAADRIKARDGD